MASANARIDIPETIKRIVVGESGGYCLNPDCRVPLFEKLGTSEAWIGECAHIKGERPGSQRFDSNLPADERNASGNLIALCPNCHRTIDKPGAEAHYTVSMLHRWKDARRTELDGRAAQHVMDVGFQELSRVVQALVNGAFHEDADDDTIVIPPDEKIAFNRLSDETRNHIVRGLARRQEVARYLHYERRVYPNITAIIRASVVDVYRRWRARASADALFHAVWNEISAGLYSDRDRAAALIVTCYFFEACDIFERPLS